MSWDAEIQEALHNERYDSVISFYEEKIDNGEGELNDYWLLGLSHLLHGDETTAQLIWSIGFTQAVPLSDVPATQLCDCLKREAFRQSQNSNKQTAHLIRSHLYNINEDDSNNILQLLQLKIQLDLYKPNYIVEFNLCEQIHSKFQPILNIIELENFLIQSLNFPGAETIIFLRSSLYHIEDKQNLFQKTKSIIKKFTYQKRILFYAEAISEIFLEIFPENISLLETLRYIKFELKKFKEALSLTQKLYYKAEKDSERAKFSGLLFSTALQAGDWEKSQKFMTLCEQEIHKIKNLNEAIAPRIASTLVLQSGFFLYCNDDIGVTRKHHNSVAKILENSLTTQKSSRNGNQHSSRRPEKKNKIRLGYIGHTWRTHSVGWLCRWLFQHHDRNQFEIYIYFVDKNQINQNCQNPFFRTWFAPYIDEARELGNDPDKIASTIQSDNIDILIDVDSTTLSLTCHVMALKPAPLQVTWLGRDATGLSTVDYFIADPYVLPEYADHLYQESIWRLPNAYIAVSGFEVGVPTLHRKDLGIPTESMVYLSAQSAMKRNPDLIHQQMKIIKQVPNSYLLIKGIADEETIQALFTRIAMEAGVDPNQLRFLPRDPDEYIHRANLTIADVILDTYPYNGATTTLETLWLGIPIVSRAGEQFAARNTYTFMKNVGVEEGIAWSDKDYVNWGIRLGQDIELRKSVVWKLKQSRQCSPLWNVEQFAREMEAAYLEMWAIYIQKLNSSISAG